MSCDEICCNHGCNQGRNCPARVAPIKSSTPVHTEDDQDLTFELSPVMVAGILLSVVAVAAMVIAGVGFLLGFIFH